MAMPAGLRVLDTQIGFPSEGNAQYDFILRQTKDAASDAMHHPAEYMFKDVPKNLDTSDPIGTTLREMDKYNIQIGVISCQGENSQEALKRHPDRFIPSGGVADPNDVTGSVRAIRQQYEEYGIRSASVFPCGTFPQVAIDAPQMYPLYQACVDLDIPIFVNAGVCGPRLKYAPQDVSRIDTVMYDFPELVFVTWHGCEPWEQLMCKLMLKWPNLYYATSAFAPKHYPKLVIDYANTRGADKIIYAGYFPAGLSLERIFEDMPHVPFRDHVWEKFLYGNAARLLKVEN